MSVNAATTVSIAPASTAVRSSASVSIGPATLLPMLPGTIAGGIWPGRSLRNEPLGGGITNHNFKVSLEGDEAFVLRIGGKDTDLLGIERRAEPEPALAAPQGANGPGAVAYLHGGLATRALGGEP